jgi:acetyl esterase/lipase
MASNAQPILPGRLGRPDLQLRDDPRADPRMLAAMAPIGMDVQPPPAPVGLDSEMDAVLAFIAESEQAFDGMFEAVGSDPSPLPGVERTVEVIKGVDGNDITLYVHRPAGAGGATLPGLLHLHGGGMVMLEAAGPSYRRWRDELAAAGMVVVGVEFRNGAGKHGPFPFPAGLNDCASALAWVGENKARLGIGKLVVSGESGGGNLTLATALKAKADGRLGLVDGVYAQCPYISGRYVDKDPALVSLYENDGFMIDCAMAGALVRAYDPTGENRTNPLAWPYHAETGDLAGLPPHVISVNELDPLRDEGLAYHRKLLRAGVSSVGRTVNGTCHAGDCIFAEAMPDVYRATIRDIKGFADSL